MRATFILSLVFTFVAQAHAAEEKTVTVICKDDGNITFTTSDFPDEYIRIVSLNCEFERLTGDNTGEQNVTIGCFNASLGVNFRFIVAPDPTQVTGFFFNHNCTEFSDTGVTAEPPFVPTFQIIADDVLDAELELTLTPNTQTLGNSASISVSLVGGSLDYYRMFLDDVVIYDDATGANAHIFQNGCPVTTLVSSVSASPGGTGSISVSLTFRALIPVLNGQFPSIVPITLRLVAFVNLCKVEDAADCFVANDCPGPADKFGRKRRDSRSGIQVQRHAEFLIFTEEAKRLEFVEILRRDIDVTNVTDKTADDGVCLNKIATIVVFVTQNTGMGLCLLATCWMFKLKRSRSAIKSSKSEYAYSNKSMKSEAN